MSGGQVPWLGLTHDPFRQLQPHSMASLTPWSSAIEGSMISAVEDNLKMFGFAKRQPLLKCEVNNPVLQVWGPL